MLRATKLSLIFRIACPAIYIICLCAVVSAEIPGIQWHTILATKNLELCHETTQIGFAQAVDKAVQKTINPCEIVTLSLEDLRLIRNTIYARNGRAFKDEKLQIYFRAQPWYKISPDYSDDVLSPDQKRNANIIQNIEELKRIDNINPDQNIINSVSDGEIQCPLAALDFVAKEEVAVKYHDLFQYELGSYQYSCSAPKAAFMPTNKEMLFIRPCMIGEENICRSDIYSNDKKKKVDIPLCPKYYLKDNSNLLIDIEQRGCCGATGWGIRFYDLSEKRLVKPSTL